MVLDGEPAMRSRWAALGGNLWMGDISKNSRDVKITGIENARIAIRMCRIKQKRIMSEAQAAHAKPAFGESA